MEIRLEEIRPAAAKNVSKPSGPTTARVLSPWLDSIVRTATQAASNGKNARIPWTSCSEFAGKPGERTRPIPVLYPLHNRSQRSALNRKKTLRSCCGDLFTAVDWTSGCGCNAFRMFRTAGWKVAFYVQHPSINLEKTVAMTLPMVRTLSALACSLAHLKA